MTLTLGARVQCAQREKLLEENKALSSDNEKAAAEASEARKKLEKIQVELAKEQSKVTEMTHEKNEIEVSTNTMLAEKESIIIGLRKELDEARNEADNARREAENARREAADARRDAGEADYACRAWKAAKMMYENLTSNLYAAVSPIISEDVEKNYRAWLEMTSLTVDPPKEMAYISPDDVDLEGEASREAGTPAFERVGAREALLPKEDQTADMDASPKA